MDSVRFGRVLGTGARLAGKTLAQAVDAATAPDPSIQNHPRVQQIPNPRQTARVGPEKTASHGLQRGKKQFGEALWGPLARASGVLWLEVTGVFFALVAVVGIDGMWINRAAIHWPTSGPEIHQHFLLGAVVAVVFGYFAVSSFVRAAHRAKKQNHG